LDPDGNEWEVFVVLKDNLPEKAEESIACCAPVAESSVDQQTAASCACATV
jgi:hypothetical protein